VRLAAEAVRKPVPFLFHRDPVRRHAQEAALHPGMKQGFGQDLLGDLTDGRLQLACPQRFVPQKMQYVIRHFWAISSTASFDCKARSRKLSTRAIRSTPRAYYYLVRRVVVPGLLSHGAHRFACQSSTGLATNVRNRRGGDSFRKRHFNALFG
jgi:hypothetical protein